jgi:hypothetical protein
MRIVIQVRLGKSRRIIHNIEKGTEEYFKRPAWMKIPISEEA